MRAGLLKYRITFLQLKEVQGWSGATTKTWEEVLGTRCAKRKLVTQGLGVTALEEFVSETVIVQVRYNGLIQDKQRFKFGRYTYRITLIEDQDDHTLLITGVRLNDNEA